MDSNKRKIDDINNVETTKKYAYTCSICDMPFDKAFNNNKVNACSYNCYAIYILSINLGVAVSECREGGGGLSSNPT